MTTPTPTPMTTRLMSLMAALVWASGATLLVGVAAQLVGTLSNSSTPSQLSAAICLVPLLVLPYLLSVGMLGPWGGGLLATPLALSVVGVFGAVIIEVAGWSTLVVGLVVGFAVVAASAIGILSWSRSGGRRGGVVTLGGADT